MSTLIHRFAPRRALLPIAVTAVALYLLGMAAPAAGGAATISTVGTWAGLTLAPFGDPNTATYGQLITVPAGEGSLESFTFYVEEPTALAFRAYVYAWEGTHAAGPALYEGPDLHTTEYSEGHLTPVTATTGGVPVTPGDKYVIFFSISNDKAIDEGTNNSGRWGYVSGEPYSGGATVYLNNGYLPAKWTTEAWSERPGEDMEFSAVFGSLPTISSVSPSTVSTATRVTVAGANFTGATQVLFGGAPAAGFNLEGEGQLSAVVPAGLSGTVDVRVITPAGESATSSADQVTIVTPPPSPVGVTGSAVSSGVAHCVVPFMRGMNRSEVERALKAADCRLGSVAHHHFHMTKGLLFEQSLHQTTIRPPGTAVSVWLSLGTRR